MIAFFTWYLSVLILGWLVFPVAYRMLPFLPERGYALSKALGLVLWGFIFWLLASLHILRNDGGGLLLSILILGLLAVLAGRSRWGEMLAWLRGHLRLVVTTEAVFLAAFGLWAVVRAAAPEAAGTEKPMELAFINAILHSSTFPPHDPWLSGYSISYYYFGYVMVAMLSRLNGLTGEIGFNLGVAGWFGLTAVAAYGLLYDLLEVGRSKKSLDSRPGSSAALAVLAPVFILFIGNFNGLLEVLHAGGVFWEKAPGGQMTSTFWRWMDIQELTQPPAEPYDFVPKRVGGIWWWRSSRVLTDYDLNGAPREVIDEFPAFSFVLGDLHPHVLAMPFALLAVGLALQLFLRTRSNPGESGLASAWPKRLDFWLAAVVLGGLAFLNTWDFPIYVGLYAAAYLVARIQVRGWDLRRFGEVAILGVLLGISGLLLYLPFFTGLSTQVGGILPSLSFFTRGVHFWVMFGTLLIPILFWALHEILGQDGKKTLRKGLGLAALVIFVPWGLSYLMGAAELALPNLSAVLVGIQGGVAPSMILLGSLAKRLAQPGMWLSMLAILAVALGLAWRELGLLRKPVEPEAAVDALEEDEERNPATGFLLLLFLVGCLLALIPEFFYLRDQFGWRMNTIFKFYFQTWILWGLVAGYASAWLWREHQPRLFILPRAAWSLLVVSGLIYIYFGAMTRTQSFHPQNWSLDGGDYLSRYQAGDYAAIAWLRDAPAGTVAEAVGGSYTDFARVATFSGQPNVLGWPGHESQWRGGGQEIGSREKDIELLYTVPDWETARKIIQQYHIRYVFVGSLEFAKYHVVEEKFSANMTLAFQNDQVRVYETPEILLKTTGD